MTTLSISNYYFFLDASA